MSCPPRLSVLIISYNTREMTLACLRSVEAETQTSYEVIVVDNASTDGSADAIATEFPNVTLLAEPQNHGFACANNLAASQAKGEYLLLLNPDTVVRDHALDRLSTFADAHPEARIWGGRTIFGNGDLNPASCWQKMTLWNVFCRTTGLTGLFPRSNLFNSEAMGGWNRDTEAQVSIVSGCFLLIRRADWQALRGFDPIFFMYGEEADLCLRATRQLGAAPRITPEATIIHYGGASESVRAEKMVRLMRAKIQLIHRHFPSSQKWVAVKLFRLWPLTRVMAFKILRKKSDTVSVWREIWRRRAEWERGFD